MRPVGEDESRRRHIYFQIAVLRLGVLGFLCLYSNKKIRAHRIEDRAIRVNLWLILPCLSWRRRMTGRLGDNHGSLQ